MIELAQALNARGLAFLQAGDHVMAIAFFREAIEHDRKFADARTNLGVAHYMAGDLPAAITAFERSIAVRPDHPGTLVNYGSALWRGGRTRLAISMLQHAIKLDPSLVEGHIMLATIYREDGDDVTAVQYCQRTLALQPNDRSAHIMLREIAQFRGDKIAMLQACEALIRFFPDDHDLRYRKALFLMAYDDPEGWRLHEQRIARSKNDLSSRLRTDPGFFARLWGKPWDGQPTRHLLVHREQGFGDVIQFLRFLPMVALRCERITLRLPPALEALAARSLIHEPKITIGAIPDKFDHYCLMMSLPLILNAVGVHPEPPYLMAKNGFPDIAALPGFKVGVAWAGNSRHVEDCHRSIPFAAIRPLFACAVSFISLQVPPVDLTDYPVLAPKLHDWDETAALIAQLDLVISADTAVAHLAGALGKPVWLLNRYTSDWRWGLQGTRTKWYPTMRIYRQPKIHDWTSVVDRVIIDLNGLAHRR